MSKHVRVHVPVHASPSRPLRHAHLYRSPTKALANSAHEKRRLAGFGLALIGRVVRV
jgi:hypothetical protein